MEQVFQEKIYAGVLGKIIGVYLGRPVEGWPYSRIIDTFGDVPYYVNEQCGMPLIVADDDISGTFGFFRALLDNPGPQITSQEFGQTWLNYIIENRTILWWGGLGRSTEHTAWLNLRDGTLAPRSGSAALNGRTLSEQVGARIFVDAIAMAFPADPDGAVAAVESAASVSHDGLAVEACRHLAAMEAIAFVEDDIEKILDQARPYCLSDDLLEVIDDVYTACNMLPSWREVRDYIERQHGYSRYPGPCHMIPNYAALIACILLGKNDFQESIRLASSMGWDTDSNAGNVGAFNGIRLGLSGIGAGADFRGPVADRLLVVTAAGGDTVTDAVLETRKIVAAAEKLNGNKVPLGPKQPRFAWEFPGATQGWQKCRYTEGRAAHVEMATDGKAGAAPGLTVKCSSVAPGTPGEFSTPTFLDFSELAGNFSTIASPTLYEGQPVRYKLSARGNGEAEIAPYVLYYDRDNRVQRVLGPAELLGLSEDLEGSWKVPNLGGMPIFRFGFQVASDSQFTGEVHVASVDWSGAPELFAQRGMMMTSIWETLPHWTQMWCASAENFAADFDYTVCVSHPQRGGLATIGTSDWDNYRVSSKLDFSLHDEGGLVVRACGHNRYYALLLSGGDTAALVKRYDGEVTVLDTTPFEYDNDRLYEVALEVSGPRITGHLGGEKVLEAEDSTYSAGEAGFIISRGSMTADGFVVEAVKAEAES